MNVAIISLNYNQDRFSYKALKLLIAHNHTVFPVHPQLSKVEDLRIYSSPASIKEPIHTVTLYISKMMMPQQMMAEIIALNPKRIIFNPGTENPELKERALEQGINALDACTIIMLNTGQF